MSSMMMNGGLPLMPASGTQMGAGGRGPTDGSGPTDWWAAACAAGTRHSTSPKATNKATEIECLRALKMAPPVKRSGNAFEVRFCTK